MTGKEKCELLKQLRKDIAAANGIEYLSADCTFDGDCLGYCPKCDAEARYLESELNRIASEGKKITITDISYLEILNSIDKFESNNKNMLIKPTMGVPVKDIRIDKWDDYQTRFADNDEG